MLPVDAFIPDFRLVIEYMGEQHTQENVLMNRRPGRREQRAAYQRRRTELLEAHRFRLVRVWHNEALTPDLVATKLREMGIALD